MIQKVYLHEITGTISDAARVWDDLRSAPVTVSPRVKHPAPVIMALAWPYPAFRAYAQPTKHLLRWAGPVSRGVR